MTRNFTINSGFLASAVMGDQFAMYSQFINPGEDEVLVKHMMPASGDPVGFLGSPVTA